MLFCTVFLSVIYPRYFPLHTSFNALLINSLSPTFDCMYHFFRHHKHGGGVDRSITQIIRVFFLRHKYSINQALPFITKLLSCTNTIILLEGHDEILCDSNSAFVWVFPLLVFQPFECKWQQESEPLSIVEPVALLS